MDEMVKEELRDEWGLQPLHEKMLEILAALDRVCMENQIPYCLAYGSALGAERHHGFIPWDDDVDVYMPFEAFDRFKDALAKADYCSGLYLQELEKICGYGTLIKLRMDGTTFIEEGFRNKDMHQGIYIDIFPLHHGKKNALFRYTEIFLQKYRVLKRLSKIDYKRSKKVMFILKIVRLIPDAFLRDVSFRHSCKYDGQDTGYYMDTFVKHPYSGLLPKTWLFPTKRMRFDTIELNVPGNNDAYLTATYGDYHQIPTIDKIKWHQHAAFWRTDEDFRNYAPNIHNYKDE